VNPMVVTSVLRAIGDLAQVGGSLMAQYVDELMPTLLEILGDASSSQKREVSLWTLSQLVASTGTVVTPYTKFPTLLDTLLGFLRTEHKTTIRSQTLRLLGLLGALDPYQHKMILGQVISSIIIFN
jgi:FKBP12-rapamycin complex-associated protein